MQGNLPVQKILQKPDDLAIYTLTSLLPMIPMPGASSRGLKVFEPGCRPLSVLFMLPR